MAFVIVLITKASHWLLENVNKDYTCILTNHRQVQTGYILSDQRLLK